MYTHIYIHLLTIKIITFSYWEEPQGRQSEPVLVLTGFSVAPANKENHFFSYWDDPQRSQSDPALALTGSSVVSPR